MRRLTRFIASSLIGMTALFSAGAQASDLDIYTNPAQNSVAAPMTVLVLDLNLLDICSNIITNPDGSESCIDVLHNKTVRDLLGLAGLGNDQGILGQLRNALRPAAGSSPAQVCAAYADIDLEEPVRVTFEETTRECALGIGIPILLCGDVTRERTFTCNPNGQFTATERITKCANSLLGLGCVLGIVTKPLTDILGGLTDALLGNLIDTLLNPLLDGLLNQLLDRTLTELPNSLIVLLGSILGGLENLLVAPTQLANVTGLVDGIVGSLANSQLAIVVSHSDRASFDGAPAQACAFQDRASIPGSRRETPNCSNGAYFLSGFLNVGDGVVTGAVGDVGNILGIPLNRNDLELGNVVSNVLGSVVGNPLAFLGGILGGNPLGDTLKVTRNLLSTLGDINLVPLRLPQILPPFQGKEVYLEIMHYLGGHELYNAPLNEWDVLTRPPLLAAGNRGARNLLGGSIDDGTYYTPPETACRTVNVLTVELTHPKYDDDSDDRLRELLPGLPAGAFSLDDVVEVAERDGFLSRDGNRINLRSMRLVNELMSGLPALGRVGNTLDDILFDQVGLFGQGGTLAKWLKPALEVDASLLTPTLTFDLAAPNRLLEPAFFGLFRPDPEQRPRWAGNLKRLRYSEGGYFDANEADAIDEDGRIKPTALSFWGPHALPSGHSADGRDTTLGGAGSKIGAPGRNNGGTHRKLHFDRHFGGTLNLPPLTLDAGSNERKEELRLALGASNAAEAESLLLYARGYDVGTTAQPINPASAVARPWLHGAVLHSQPVAINYGPRIGYSEDNPDIRVVYGAQDGFFRMVRNSDGVESWGFMPQAVMKQQKVLRDNDPTAAFPYGVDGSPTVIIQDRSSGGGPGDGVIDNAMHDRVWAYFGLRRSGRALYGMDLTDPDNPSLLWRITQPTPNSGFNLESNASVPGLSGAWFSELGLTFSRPQPARLRIGGEDRMALIFGGGYDANKDAAGLGTNDARGNALFIVDASSGELLWKAVHGNWNASAPWNAEARAFRHPMLRDSIAADVHAVDMDGDGYTDRVYATDTGGRVWRMDLPGNDRSLWTVTPVASVGRHSTPANASNATKAANDRRFFHAVDVVPVRSGDLSYDAVVFASGNRERPLETQTEDALYLLRDMRLGVGLTANDIIVSESDPRLPKHDDFADLTSLCADPGATGCASQATLTHGWKILLQGNGEKGLSQPASLGHHIFFTSYTPDSAAASGTLRCEPDEGGSRLYAVSLYDSRGGYFTDTDADATLRTGHKLSVGLPGNPSLGGVSTIRAGTEVLDVEIPRFLPIYWRERKGEDEPPLPQSAP